MHAIILIIDSKPSHLRPIEEVIKYKLEYHTLIVPGADAGADWILSGKRPQPDLVLLDLTMPDSGGLNAIRSIKAHDPQLPVVVITPYGDPDHIAQAIQAGANDFLTKPIVIERLALSLQNALRIKRLSQQISRLEHNMTGHMSLSEILSGHSEVAQAASLARQATRTSMPVWIEGEQGTGKELFARTIHRGGRRLEHPFVVLNCLQLMRSLILNGDHAAAWKDTNIFLAKMAEAAHGTLFLKEINALDAEVQTQLLEALETGEAQRFDVRIISSSSVLADSSALTQFNPVLCQRLRELVIALPPLRQRKEDIGLLVDYFIMMYSTSENKPIYGITERTRRMLTENSWPGNVRQLGHVIWKAVMRCTQEVLDIHDLEELMEGRPGVDLQLPLSEVDADKAFFLDSKGQVKKLKHLEMEAIRFALRHAEGCMTHAAKSLGIGRSTLYRKMNELGMTHPERVHYISRANQTMRPII